MKKIDCFTAVRQEKNPVLYKVFISLSIKKLSLKLIFEATKHHAASASGKTLSKSCQQTGKVHLCGNESATTIKTTRSLKHPLSVNTFHSTSVMVALRANMILSYFTQSTLGGPPLIDFLPEWVSNTLPRARHGCITCIGCPNDRPTHGEPHSRRCQVSSYGYPVLVPPTCELFRNIFVISANGNVFTVPSGDTVIPGISSPCLCPISRAVI